MKEEKHIDIAGWAFYIFLLLHGIFGCFSIALIAFWVVWYFIKLMCY